MGREEGTCFAAQNCDKRGKGGEIEREVCGGDESDFRSATKLVFTSCRGENAACDRRIHVVTQSLFPT